MRRPLTAAALLTVAMLMSACAAAQPPQWTYAPATASPSANASAGASDGASAATSAAPSAAASAPASAAPASAAASGGSAAPASGSGGAASTSLDLTAQNVQFDKTALSAPASTAFVIHFNNQDQGIPHNVTIKDGTGKDVFKPDLLTGPGKVDYNVPALPAGTYTFYCIVHPGMTGTLTVGP
ncbi:MAG TPA: cupredoxin domain-containing protein [Candidatus Limnocylindrales bacterium]